MCKKTGSKKLLEAKKCIELFVDFALEVLPQAGKICINVGTLNEALIAASKILGRRL